MKNISQHIAMTLKSLRKERELSLDQVALKTGVSKAMLGQIERLESNPTIATLWKIASGLHIPFSTFIEKKKEGQNKPINQALIKKSLRHDHDKMKVKSVFPYDDQLNFETYVIELLPHYEHLSPAHHGVIEHVITIDGVIEILLDGVWNRLSKGEGLRFYANQPHGYRNTTSKNACFHNMIHYVTF